MNADRTLPEHFVTITLTDIERRALAYAADLGVNHDPWPNVDYRLLARAAREKLLAAPAREGDRA